MDRVGIEGLRDAIRATHGCDSRWVKTARVREVSHGAVVWDGEVQVFELAGHPRAKRAYAWSYETEGPEHRVHAVLGVAPIESAADAVKAVLREEAHGHAPV